MTSFFPDVNVWLALTYQHHGHHDAATEWLEAKDDSLVFCRLTQLGLLRLLTNEQVMAEDVLTQRKAWDAYRRWFDDERVSFHDEPDAARLESTFEELSTRSRTSTKLWTDAYLAAFARTAGLTLVTFDRALRTMPSVSVELLA
jgi:uncharacterized protein